MQCNVVQCNAKQCNVGMYVCMYVCMYVRHVLLSCPSSSLYFLLVLPSSCLGYEYIAAILAIVGSLICARLPQNQAAFGRVVDDLLLAAGVSEPGPLGISEATT